MRQFSLALLLLLWLPAAAQEKYRPKFHFSPKEDWTNDPNGMFYYKGQYHLFFQYYPDSTVWGPMHWGHAVSRDMVHWEERPIALYPDSLGYIFSGSAVVDVHNTSGFGRDGQTPIVAIFTHHDPVKEKMKRKDYQVQSIAYSLDEGHSWTKYEGNPVLPNPGTADFRDPKVMWYEPGKKWMMTLAMGDRTGFYSSLNLRDWKKESEFGEGRGAHGGVWECPDLFPLEIDGKNVWVLLVSINPGGPNGGSATQYFLGEFDGQNFVPLDDVERWMDYGTDNYAGVTFSNTGTRKILMGWMSNWQYANVVPTKRWRGAFTIPRELSVTRAGGKLFLASRPVKEFSDKVVNISRSAGKSFSVMLSNAAGERLMLGYDKHSNRYYIDRTKAGEAGFEKGFAKRIEAPRLARTGKIDMQLVIDATSVEMFADDGLTVMTCIFFPRQPLSLQQN